MTPLAFIDESEPGDRRDPGAYILAAVIIEEAHVGHAQDVLRALKPRTARKLHWTESDRAHRLRVVAALNALDLSFVGIVGLNDPSVRSERRRRMALQRMVFELTRRDVSTATLESRGPADRRDRDFIDAMRARRAIAGIRIEHAPGIADPMLWAADAICGVVAADRKGDCSYRNAIDTALEVIEHLA